jgi:hypothetical protein
MRIDHDGSGVPQLGTAHAPGAIFTWEGGKGACLSVPIDGAAIDFSALQTRRKRCSAPT